VLDRGQMFGPVGGRPSTVNKIKIGSTADGKLVAMQHDVVMDASVMEDFVEHAEGPTKSLYRSESNSVTAKVVEMNLGVSTFMRAPGEAPGTAVLEIAMDELAEKLNIDPVQLRLTNYAESDPSHDRPWTSKHLRDCYAQASERFGWSRSALPNQGRYWTAIRSSGTEWPPRRTLQIAAQRMQLCVCSLVGRCLLAREPKI
jgi:xanthine dehydrogenase YagR molybdenum-binding subunit